MNINAIEKKEYAQDKKIMMRYAKAYAKKNGERALSEEQVEDILAGIIAVTQAFACPSPHGIARALIELGHLAKKYGAKLVEKLYDNYRKRFNRREKQKETKAILPTGGKLKKFLTEHEIKEGDPKSHEDLKKFFKEHLAEKPNNTLLKIQSGENSA